MSLRDRILLSVSVGDLINEIFFIHHHVVTFSALLSLLPQGIRISSQEVKLIL